MSEFKAINLGELDINVESRLGFKPDITSNNGICLAKITKVELVETEHKEIKDDGTISNFEYKKLTTTALLIEFEQVNIDPKDTSKRYLTHVEKIISSYGKNGEMIDPKVFNALLLASFSRLQHIVNAFDNSKIAPLSTKIKDLSIVINDTAEIKASKFKKMFTHFYNQIKGVSKDVNAKPRYENVIVWLKVVADYSSCKYYNLPQFVGKGFIQIAEKTIPCHLELAPNESITLIASKGKGSKSMDATPTEQAAQGNAPMSVDDVLASILNKQ